jgi:hypothetical protein
MIRPAPAPGLSIVNAVPEHIARNAPLLALRRAGRTAAD